MQWAAPEYRSEQENPVAEPANGKRDSITGRWRNRTFPRVRRHLKNRQQWGASGLVASESSCLNVKSEIAPEGAGGYRTEVMRSDERNSSGKMTMPRWIQGYWSAVVTGLAARRPMLRVTGNTCYLLLHNRILEYTPGGTMLSSYRTRIFERVDLM